MPGKDLYKILGVNKTCSDSELKKAYRKLAIKHHPDKNQDNVEEAEKKFKEISHAYSILSDPKKKEIYDHTGDDRAAEEGMPQMNPNDIFSQFMGGMGGMGGFPGMSGFSGMGGMNGFPGMGGMHGHPSRGQRRNTSSEPIQVQTVLTLEEIYCGCKKDLEYKIKVGCELCKETGNKNKKPSICPDCDGQGQRVSVRQMGHMVQKSISSCPKCKGSGKIENDSPKCKKCNGQGYNITDKKIRVSLDASPDPQIMLSGMGHKINKGNKDVLLRVVIQEHDIFKLKDNHIVLQLDLTQAQSVVGFKKKIKFLDGTDIILERTKPTLHEELLVIPNKGIKKQGQQGALLIQCNVKINEAMKLSEDDAKKIKEILSQSSFEKEEHKKELTITGKSEFMISADEYKESSSTRSHFDHEEESQQSNCQVA